MKQALSGECLICVAFPSHGRCYREMFLAGRHKSNHDTFDHEFIFQNVLLYVVFLWWNLFLRNLWWHVQPEHYNTVAELFVLLNSDRNDNTFIRTSTPVRTNTHPLICRKLHIVEI